MLPLPLEGAFVLPELRLTAEEFRGVQHQAPRRSSPGKRWCNSSWNTMYATK
jgi:hypothetical protein